MASIATFGFGSMETQETAHAGGNDKKQTAEGTAHQAACVEGNGLTTFQGWDSSVLLSSSSSLFLAH